MRSLGIAAGLVCSAVQVPFAHAGGKTQSITTVGPLVSGEDGMVVSSNSDAARVGAMVLAQGGNAVDAAIAMEFALNVSEPPFSGIGGGGFMVIYEAATQEVTIIDSRERAPASAEPDMFLRYNPDTMKWEEIPLAERRKFGTAVGVPGALAGAQTALDLFGTWSLKQTLDPAVELADNGVIVTQLLEESIAANLALLAGNEAASEVFLPGGQPLQAGDLLVQPDLADTFRLLQKKGIDAFYGGEIGEAFVAEVQAMGGGMTMQDLADYEVTIDEPVSGHYGDYEIVSTAPPSSGGLTVLQTLAILDHWDLEQFAGDPVARYHLTLQALQLAFADRNAYLGDPEFVEIPLEGWLDPEYIEMRAGLLAPDSYLCLSQMAGPVPGSTGEVQSPQGVYGGETTHMTVADRWGNLVAFTTTIEQVFGTGHVLPGYGFILNNELTDFNSFPGSPNEVQPDKRPMSSIAPTIVFEDGEPVMTIGSPGGPRIIGSVVQVLINVLDLGLDLQTAVALPRVFSSSCSASPNVRWDAGFPADVRAGLTALGYKFEAAPQEVGNVNMMSIEDGTYTGAADPRREGVVIGLTDAIGKPKKNK